MTVTGISGGWGFGDSRTSGVGSGAVPGGAAREGSGRGIGVMAGVGSVIVGIVGRGLSWGCSALKIVELSVSMVLKSCCIFGLEV